MMSVPVPDGMAEAMGGRAMVIGDAGMSPADENAPMPCEYVVRPSQLYPGRHQFTVFLVLDEVDRAAIQDGASLALTLDGGELPWSIEVGHFIPWKTN